MLVPIVVMAIGAGEVELPLSLREQLVALLKERCKLRVGCGYNGHAARLMGDEGREREQIMALIVERRRLLPLGAAQIDPLLQVDRTAE